MKLNHKLLDISYPFIKNFFISKCQFRILNFHDIQQKDFNNFEKILKKLKNEWDIISPIDFEKKKIRKKKSLLITFDDGFKSQYFVAKRILEPLKIKAIFFVVTDFIKINSKIKAKKFIVSNINKEICKNSTRLQEMENMSLKDVIDLSLAGHTIGSHTCRHSKLTIVNKNLLAKELIQSKYFLMKLLKKNIDYFAYTYGDIKSINQHILSNIKKEYKYIFSGIRGNNFYSYKNNRIFFRDEINPTYTENVINSFLNGFTDLYYYSSRKKIKK